VVGLLVVGLCGPSSAIPPPEDLPRGADTVVPHLVFSVPPVIKAPGVEIPLPPAVTTDSDWFGLVGRTDLGWLVLAAMSDGEGGTDRDSLHLVTATGSTKILEFGHFDGSPHYRLSASRTRVIRFPTGDIAQYLTVYDLTGKVLAHRKTERDLHDYAFVHDFTGTRVIYDNRSWRLGERPRVLTSLQVDFADIGNNTLVVKEKVGQRRAVATLSHPGRFRWRAYFHPRMISPDGSRIAGWHTTRRGTFKGILQVRRLSDGKLLTSIDASEGLFGLDGPLIRWEGNSALVFPESYDPFSGPQVLVRCTLAKVCSRASEPAERFSFALRPGW